MIDAVGPVLRMSEEIPGVIDAIRDDNPDSDIEVIDRGAYVRIQSPHSMRVTQDSLHRHIGPDYELRSLGAIMSAFAGRISTSADEFRWEHKTTTAAGRPQES